MSDSKFLRSLFRSQAGPVVALLVVVFAFAVADYFYGSGSFATLRNLRTTANSASLIAIPALGMTLIIIAGGIDLSAGTALTLCGTILATKLKYTQYSTGDLGFASAVAFALATTLLVGCVCGLINGALITSTKVVPFIVTLGTMTIFLGIGQIISQEATVQPPTDHVPEWLGNLCHTGGGKTESSLKKYLLVPYVPTSVIVTLVLATLLALTLKFTVFGRNVYAIGSNASTARLCGINVPLNMIAVYALAGLFTGIGGIVYFSNVPSMNPSDGLGSELEMIAAVVLGGGSLAGGRGSVLGTLVGAAIIVSIRKGCALMDIPDPYTKITIGAIIILAVIVDQLRNGSPEWLFRLIAKSESR